ncbi:MAG: zinc ribbon domain-containing protein [Bacillales bacterium]|nr:zinc ribbon domain-containing protein [Bacillales bacterium]
MIKVRNCPSCAGPLKENDTICPFCGSSFILENTKEINKSQSFYIKVNEKDYWLDFYNTFGYKILKCDDYPNNLIYLVVELDMTLQNREELDDHLRKYGILANSINNKKNKKVLLLIVPYVLLILSLVTISLGILFPLLLQNDSLYILLKIGIPVFVVSLILVIIMMKTSKIPFYLNNKTLKEYRDKVKNKLI